jgi:hypothetical protein
VFVQIGFSAKYFTVFALQMGTLVKGVLAFEHGCARLLLKMVLLWLGQSFL